METDIFGTIVAFEDLQPGEIFISNWTGSAVFGIATKFREDEGIVCAILKAPSGQSFGIDSLPSNEPVWKINGAIVRPKIKSEALKLVSQITVGALILAAEGAYLICKHGRNGSIVRINLSNGLVSTPADPHMMTTSWEIGIRDSQTQEWCRLYDSDI